MRKGSRSWRLPVALGLLPVLLVAGCQADPVAPPPPPPPTPIVVGVSPLTAEVPASGALTLSASVVNDTSNRGVTWTLSGPGCAGATCGTLSVSSSASGAAVAYSAPSTVPDPATVAVTATSVTDNAKSASATVTVVPAPLRLVFASVSSRAVMGASRWLYSVS